jgi:DNA recombination-dependent growth factor C
MSLVKGTAALCRYRVLEEPQKGGVTPEYVQGRLRRNAFVDIEAAPEESSVGWVEILDHLSCDFADGAFDFGEYMGFSLRLDERKLPGKILNRYYAIAEAKFIKENNGKKPNSHKKNQIKESLRLDLLRRSLLSTSVWQAVWLTGRNEVWLDAASERVRGLFEDLWARTFGLGLRLLVPISLGLELLPEALHDKLVQLDPVRIWG